MSVIRSRVIQNLPLGLLAVITSSFSPCFAGNIELQKEPASQFITTSPWQVEFGSRYWYSTAKYRENLSGDPGILVSRLTYEQLDTNAAEAFWKIKHVNGIYLKGYLGGGAIGGGHLIDEDFPPGISPYSRTISPQKNGSINYLSADLGYDVFTAPTWRLGGFVGYHYWQEEVNNFGCTQLATGGPVCVNSLALTVDTLNNTATWNSLRLGINGEIRLGHSFNLETDLAYIHSSLEENDYHNLRSSIRGVLDTGPGNGMQLDVILKWLLTEDFNVGIGGRWWYLVTNGWAHFEQIATPGQPQPMDGIQNRYGLLVQASYQFADRPHLTKDNDSKPEFNWKGTYLGANIGYATNANMVYIYPASTNAQNLQAADYSPFSLNVQNAGFLGGGQLGYNWQINRIILGVEGDFDYAQIGTANAVTSTLPLTTTVNPNIRWLSSIRGRIGKLASDNMLIYLTTGPTWGSVKLAFDQRDVAVTSCAVGPVCITSTENSIKTGWSVGGGLEYAVSPHVTLKAEYLYIDLGSLRFNPSGIGTLGETSYLVSTGFNDNTLRLGINYKI